MSDFNTPTTFDKLEVGQRFIEGLTISNEIAQRIGPTMLDSKLVNARRESGKLIFIEWWEPVFIAPSGRKDNSAMNQKPEEDPREEGEEDREICPYCDGTNISPYERDGGSCPHCFGGYVK